MNNHEEGGIKVIDTESLMKSLWLCWQFRHMEKNYLEYILKDSGVLLLFNCNFYVNDLPIYTSNFI